MVAVSILVVVVSMFMSLVLKGIMTDQLGIGWAGGIVNGVMIQVFNQLYGRLAAGLTEWENHKYVLDAVCFVYTCRRLIDLSLILPCITCRRLIDLSL